MNATNDEAACEIERLRAALVCIRDTIKRHPIWMEITQEEEIEIGGDTAVFSYLSRVADEALKPKAPVEPDTTARKDKEKHDTAGRCWRSARTGGCAPAHGTGRCVFLAASRRSAQVQPPVPRGMGAGRIALPEVRAEAGLALRQWWRLLRWRSVHLHRMPQQLLFAGRGARRQWRAGRTATAGADA